MTAAMVTIDPDNGLTFNPHRGQWAAWNATERIVAVVAGTQSGKTTFGPFWLLREMKTCGAGVYLIAAPTDPLLQVKLIPEFKRLFLDMMQLGTYVESPRPKFVLSKEGERRLWGSEQSEPTVVFFGYALKPDSLESMTAKAAWLDEAGQGDFKVGSWEAILRRLSLSQGRILITTTPYITGHWLRRRVFDKRNDKRESIRVIQFKSTDNPVFPRDEYERAKRELPPFRFAMMYRGQFEKPAGQIFDCFDPRVHVVPRFALPERWPRYLGLDFGGVNTFGVFFAENPVDKSLFLYRVYGGVSRTAKMHVEHLLKTEPKMPIAYGGAGSEDQWREEFKDGGMPVGAPPVTDVEIGIDRVYAELANQNLFIFDDLDDMIDEVENYSRKVDEEGNVLDVIEDKNTFHRLDATRYLISSIRSMKPKSGYTRTKPSYVELDEGSYVQRK